MARNKWKNESSKEWSNENECQSTYIYTHTHIHIHIYNDLNVI